MMFKTLALAAVLFASPVAAAAQAKPAPAAATAPADVVVKVNGLVCDFCARSLEKAFKGTKTVSHVAVDLTAKEVRLSFLPGQSLDDAAIKRLVTSAGYAVVGVQRRQA